MNLPGEPDEQKEKTKIQPFIRKISKHHFDTQRKSLCSQSSDVFFLCRATNTTLDLAALFSNLFIQQEKTA